MDPVIQIPRVVAPPFWLANLNRVHEYLNHRLQRGRLVEFGRSALDHPLYAVHYNENAMTPPGEPGSPGGLIVMGGTHGHEPGTVAAAMNLIHLLEAGRDLDDQPHDNLRELLQNVHLTVIPVFNPDGRAVNLDTYYNLGVEAVTIYACGIDKQGELIPYDADSLEPLYYFNPDDALFVGGQFNGAGHAINRIRNPHDIKAVEVSHLIDFLGVRQYDALFDMHACGFNFAFQVRSHEPPYWSIIRDWQRRAEKLFAEKDYPLNPLHGDGDPPEPLTFHFNSPVMHSRCELMWIAFEGRQGYSTKLFWPIKTEWEIIDAYLLAIEAFIDLGLTGAYAAANAEIFG